MNIAKVALPRRTFLRGMGVTLAVPFLDAMVPALTPIAKAAAPPRRLGFVYVPNGAAMKHWQPTGDGALDRAVAVTFSAGAVSRPDDRADRSEPETGGIVRGRQRRALACWHGLAERRSSQAHRRR